MLDRRHIDKEAARQGDVRGDAGTLLRDGLLGDLHENLLPLAEKVGDGRLIAPIITVTAAAALGAFAVARLTIALLTFPWLTIARLALALLIVAAFAFASARFATLSIAAAPAAFTTLARFAFFR
ncbi:MAG TPA: hypothetical protein VNC50_06330 [Planctomycetia bacterium]|nr:hypothetical protein [Planctomycetia bacterium]